MSIQRTAEREIGEGKKKSQVSKKKASFFLEEFEYICGVVFFIDIYGINNVHKHTELLMMLICDFY